MNLSRLEHRERGTGRETGDYGLGVCSTSNKRFAVMMSGLSGSWSVPSE